MSYQINRWLKMGLVFLICFLPGLILTEVYGDDLLAVMASFCGGMIYAWVGGAIFKSKDKRERANWKRQPCQEPMQKREQPRQG